MDWPQIGMTLSDGLIVLACLLGIVVATLFFALVGSHGEETFSLKIVLRGMLYVALFLVVLYLLGLAYQAVR